MFTSDLHDELVLHLEDSPEVTRIEDVDDGAEVVARIGNEVAGSDQFNKAIKCADAVSINFERKAVMFYFKTEEDG